MAEACTNNEQIVLEKEKQNGGEENRQGHAPPAEIAKTAKEVSQELLPHVPAQLSAADLGSPSIANLS